MTVDLTVIPTGPIDTLTKWAPTFGELRLPPSHNLYDGLADEIGAQPMPDGVGISIGGSDPDDTKDAYGARLRWCAAGDLYLALDRRARRERLARGEELPPRLASCIAYLGALPHNNVVILYWH